MKLVLDEHYSATVARALRDGGHDVLAVVEDADLRGASDDALFAWARREHRAIVTQDLADFVAIAREAAVSGTSHYGIVLTSPQAFPPAAGGIGRLVAALAALLDERRAEGALSNQVHWLRPAE